MLNEGPAPKGSYGAKKANLITHDEPVGIDFQGWPQYQQRIISLLRVLMVSEDIIKQIPKDILETRISTLEEDGMGYGINKRKCIDLSIDHKQNIVYIWS